MNALHTAAVGLTCLIVTGCAAIAVRTAPAKVATTQRSELALQADAVFWETLHGGDYEGIDRALQGVTAAYLQDPHDAVTAAHVGWMHIWHLAESARSQAAKATLTDDAVLARRYFQEAVALDPTDPRYLGFLGATLLTEGAIHQDDKLARQGYFTLLDSIQAWPEFNLFTAGYMMSNRPAESERFKQGLQWQWQTLDLCAGTPVDRHQPDFAPFMARAVTTGAQRVCWNSWIAPHNFEGFFLNMGDMLVKAGDWQTALKIYANAKHSPDYGQWRFAAVLQSHIDHAQDNVAVFNGPQAERGAAGDKIMFASSHACMACHQR